MSIMSKSPEISVLMPVFNTEQYLKSAIDSILNQTFQDFEFVIINDGSTDSSEEIILSYSDSRIKYYKNTENIGIVATRNKGIDLCTGRFIAILDSDDIALPERLQKQWNFLNANPELAMLGGAMELIDSENQHIKIVRTDSPSHLIKTKLFFENRFVHSTVFIRRSILAEFRYSADYKFYAEDYFLWSQIVFKYPVANLPEVFVKYRVHQQSMSIRTKNMEKQRNTIMKIHAYHLNQLDIYPSAEELNLHYKLLYNPAKILIFNRSERKNMTAWIEKILRQNEILQVYDKEHFFTQLKNRWSLREKLQLAYLKIKKKVKRK
jgi:glycosyltransferase involved in cell wall biosynthesis